MSHIHDRVRLTTATNPVDMGLVTSIRAQLNNQTDAPAVGGAFDPYRRLTLQQPDVSFGTEAIKQALDLVGITGLCFDAEDANKTHKEFRYLANRLDACGTEGRDDGDVHLAGVSKKGLLLLQSLSFSQSQPSRCSLIGYCLTNVAKDPALTQVYDQSLQTAINLTQNPDAEKSFAFYGFNLLGNALPEVTDGTIDFEYVLERPQEANGTIWPGKIRIVKYRQRVRLNLSDPTILTRIVAESGSKVTHANTELQLVQIDPDGHWTTLTDTDHIKIPIEGKAYIGAAYQSDDESSSSSDLVIESAKTTAPLLFQTDVFLQTPPP